MADPIGEFCKRYNIDERGTRALEALSTDDLEKVITGFAPREQTDSQDYSRKLMGYMRLVMGSESGDRGMKRGRSEMESASGLAMSLSDPLSILGSVDLEAFREKFPMDDRAFEFLAAAGPGVQARVVQTFNPRSAGDSNYSGLVTSFVKKVRQELGGAEHGGNQAGASQAELEDFRSKFPMDDRAWEYLQSAPGFAQVKVTTEFRPRKEDDTDYSAAVTAFVKSISQGKGAGKGKAPLQLPERGSRFSLKARLETFRHRFPMDTRAYEFLASCEQNVILDVLEGFAPRNMHDTDYSRPITSYIKQCRDRAERDRGGRVYDSRSTYHGRDSGYGRDIRDVRDVRDVLDVRDVRNVRDVRDVRDGQYSRHADGGYTIDEDSSKWLRSFRTCFPMDTRAWEYLEQCPIEIQESVISEFRPRHYGEDDYSGAVTSFVRRVRSRLEAGPPGVRLERPSTFAPANLLEGFKGKYPMDDRAWEFLKGSSASVQRAVMERFRPQREGERDYSRLITSFIRSTRE